MENMTKTQNMSTKMIPFIFKDFPITFMMTLGPLKNLRWRQFLDPDYVWDKKETMLFNLK